MNPDTLTAQALLNCLVREVSAPEEQTREADGHLLVRLARSDRVLRLTTRRPSAGLGPRLTGDAELGADEWQPVGWETLATLIADELTLATGVPTTSSPRRWTTAMRRSPRSSRPGKPRPPRQMHRDQPAPGGSPPSGPWPLPGQRRRSSPGTGSTRAEGPRGRTRRVALLRPGPGPVPAALSRGGRRRA